MPNELMSENRQLRDEFSHLMEQARRNQEIMRRHQEFDLKCIGAESFKDLFDSIFQTLPESSDLDVVTLSLLDPRYDIRRSLVDLSINLADFPHLLFLQDESELSGLQADLQHAVLGPYSEQAHGTMFPEPIAIPVSVAIVPLRRNQRLIGSLNLGSNDPERFGPNMGSDFIERLASILAICLENVINSERLKHTGLTDALTGVNNRRYVERRLQEEVGRTRRNGSPLSCMYIDIDHFKKINDSVGHQGGDKVLREVAGRIKAELRVSDALGRFGGEEFLVILIDAELSDAICVAERIRASMADQPVALGIDETTAVTVSIGVAAMTPQADGDTIDSIAQKFIARADQALYQAKAHGRNRVICAD